MARLNHPNPEMAWKWFSFDGEEFKPHLNRKPIDHPKEGIDLIVKAPGGPYAIFNTGDEIWVRGPRANDAEGLARALFPIWIL